MLSHLPYCVASRRFRVPPLEVLCYRDFKECRIVSAVRLCCNLRKYDHVSASFYHRLSWLPLPCFIQFRSLCLMYRQYNQFQCIPLEPPIVFGRTSSYSTRTPAYFANISIFRLSFPQRFSVLKQHNGGIYYHPL